MNKIFRDLKVGDNVTRMLAGKIPIELKVTAIDDKTITCGAWIFDINTGGEIDYDLGWDGVKSGSFLILK